MAAAAATSASDHHPIPILSRVERLDLMMSYLEEVKGRTVRSASTTSSGTTTAVSDAGNSSSVNSSPRSLEKRCRPMDDVVVEAQVKGSLIERLDQLESRLLKLEEEDVDDERKRRGAEGERIPTRSEKKKQKKGLKSLVKSCVRGKLMRTN